MIYWILHDIFIVHQYFYMFSPSVMFLKHITVPNIKITDMASTNL